MFKIIRHSEDLPQYLLEFSSENVDNMNKTLERIKGVHSFYGKRNTYYKRTNS